ncbi:MAG: hypothetical protein ACTSX7_00045 [Alphaproteobacteria bacterium]
MVRGVSQEFTDAYLEYARQMLSIARRKNARGVRSGDGLEWSIPDQLDENFPAEVAEKCAKLFFNEKIIADYQMSNEKGPIKNPAYDVVRWVILTYISFPLRESARESESLYFRKDRIERVLEKYIYQWKTGTAEIAYVAPLHNVDIAGKEICLQSIFEGAVNIISARIVATRHMSKSIAQRVSNSAFTPGPFRSEPACMIEIVAKEQNRRGSPADYSEQVRLLVTSMRLCGSTHAGTPGLFAVPVHAEGALVSFSSMEELDTSSGIRFNERTRVSKKSLREMTGAYAVLQTIASEKSVTIRRYNSSFSRKEEEDRIIDVAIFLESILGSDRTEITHKLSLRCATALAKRRQPKETVLLVKDLYDIRSRIVHGTHSVEEYFRKSKRYKNARDFVALIGGVAQDLMQEIVFSEKGINDLTNRLDARVLESI